MFRHSVRVLRISAKTRTNSFKQMKMQNKLIEWLRLSVVNCVRLLNVNEKGFQMRSKQMIGHVQAINIAYWIYELRMVINKI